jgi:hypothetical protein
MRRKPSQITTGRLQSLRLFSTLLSITLIMALRWALECNGLVVLLALGAREGHLSLSPLLSPPPNATECDYVSQRRWKVLPSAVL